MITYNENLIINSVHTMRRVVNFLGEEWEDSTARFSGKNDEYEKVFAITGKASTTLDRLRKPLDKDRIGIWRYILSEDEIKAIRNGILEKGLLDLFLSIEQDTVSLLDNVIYIL